VATAVATLVDKQILARPTALKELKTLSGVTNFGTNITDDDIKQAEDDEKEARENPPEPDGLAALGAHEGAGDHPGSGTVGPRTPPAKPRANGAGAADV
jgi:hypothetical protein